MNFKKLNIPDVILIKPEFHQDERGFFCESFREDKFQSFVGLKKFVQDNHTSSKKNVLRGLHYQIKQPQGKIVRVIKGKIFDVAVDLRKNSKTFGQYYKCILSEKNSKSIFIPPGFAHGFQALEKENYVVYSCTKYRDAKSEVSIKFNDKTLKIKWPLKKMIVSKKDMQAITFLKFKKK